VAARAAKAVVQLEVAECGIEIISKDEPNDPTPDPDAFAVAGWPVNDLCGLGVFVRLALVLPPVFRSICRRCCGGLALVLGVQIPTLGSGAADAEQDRERGGGKVPQNRISKLKPSTHKFTNSLTDRRRERGRAGVMAPKWVSNAAETSHGIP